jgi:WD40 repeat protein
MFDFHPVTAPYPGLRPFEPHESEIFFGREGHTDRLLEILQRERFLAVIGPSGSGKSSLVRAGLLPGLAAGSLGTGSHWRLALLRPGGQPLLALAQALLSPHALGRELLDEAARPAAEGEITADAALLAAQLRQGLPGLRRLLQSAAARRPADSPPLNLLILADQFEEVFTYRDATADPDEPAAFVDLLLAARAEPDLRIYVALTMRTDFLGHCVGFLDLPEAINRAQYLTPRLKPEEMKRAICGPAPVLGGEVDSAFADEIIARVGHDSDQLPMLQHALACWWRVAEADDANAPRISRASTKDVGEVDQALDRHAEDLFRPLPPSRQAATEALFRAITVGREGGAAVRRPQRLDDIAAWTAIERTELEAVIKDLAAPEVSFVHYGCELGEGSVIDLTHEALMRQWDRLKKWVEDEYRRGQGYQRWSARAAEHAEHKGGLLTGADLARALDWGNPGQEGEGWRPSARWAARYSAAKEDALAAEFEQTRQFLQDSRDAEQREREEEQRRLEAQAEAERRRADRERELAQAASEAAARATELAKEARESAAREAILAEVATHNARRARWLAGIAAVVAVAAILAAVFGWWQSDRAQKAEQSRTASLFDSQLTHASLLTRGEDYAEARRTLADSTRLDAGIPASRRHARNLLAGYEQMMGGQAEQVYVGEGAALSGGVAVSPDGKLLAAAGERATLVLFDAESGTLLWRLEGHDPAATSSGSVRGIAFDPQGTSLYSGGDDGRIIRWSLPAGDKLGQWEAPGRVRALALSPDGKLLASGGPDGVITLWSVPEGKVVKTLEGHRETISSSSKGLSFSPDGKRLASASIDRTARIWDVQSGKTLHVLEGHTDLVTAVAFNPDGDLLATSSSDKRLVLWDVASGKPIRILTGHQNIVFGIAFSADGSQLLSASRDNILRLWDVASGTTRRIYQGHEAGLWSVGIRGQRLYTAADDGTVRRWSLATPRQWMWETGEPAISTAISPDGRLLTVGLKNGALRFYALPDGQLQSEIADAHRDQVLRIAFSPDGRLLATGSHDHTAKLWRIDKAAEGGHTASLLHTIEEHRDSVHAVAFSPDGRRLATASYDGQIGAFDVATGKGRLIEAHEGQVLSVAFDPTGEHLLSAGADFRLRLWDVRDLDRPPRDIARVQDKPMWASLSPNGRELAAVGREQTVTLLDLARPDAPQRLVGHEQTVFRASYSPDGRQLATVGGDMTVRLWDLDHHRLLFTLQLPTEFTDGPWDFDFRCTSAGECWIAVPLVRGRVAVYRLPYENPPADVAGSAGGE